MKPVAKKKPKPIRLSKKQLHLLEDLRTYGGLFNLLSDEEKAIPRLFDLGFAHQQTDGRWVCTRAGLSFLTEQEWMG